MAQASAALKIADRPETPPHRWRTVAPADLDALVPWLIGKLQRNWPRLEEGHLRQWLMATMNDRMTIFCRTERVCGVFFVERDVMEPIGIVREKFVRHNGADLDEQRFFYARVADWAKSLGVRYLRINEDSDCVMKTVAPALTDVKQFPTYVVTFGK